MKTLYLDCSMGAAGDMLAAALLELMPDPEKFVEECNHLGIPGVHIGMETSVKCGITGTHLSVTVNGEEEESHDVHEHAHSHGDAHDHSHSSLHDIEHIIRDHLLLPQKVQNNVMAVYTLIAEAESRAHGKPVEEIHFHEVGTMDAVADITMVCLLMDRLSPDEVIASPIHVGSGQVCCTHGILPVPAPATAHILQGVPMYGGSIKGELCTPTGAALLKHFADRFGEMQMMKTTAIGYGMGKKDFEAANCVRAMYGETDAVQEEICELSCNVDDMTSEAVGFAMEQLLREGALDVYTMPVGMKKSRPGILIHVMCRKADKETMERSIFKYTTTIGIRENRFWRYALERRMEALETPYGLVRYKVSIGYGVERRKYEYEDLSRIAKEKNISISEAEILVKKWELLAGASGIKNPTQTERTKL